jgi:stearoyl-CoA desaturase (delta-9 desaturase)
MPQSDWATAPRNWLTTLMFLLTAVAAAVAVPWYGLAHQGYTAAAWICFVAVLSLNELSITCGYHRLFAHATYRALAPLRLLYLLFGAMALQNTALLWSAGHRAHHRYIDDPQRDPYCAKRGFWFSHIGWMLRNYPSGVPDLGTVNNLKRDRLVMWQHDNYLAITLTMNFGLPLLLGWAVGDLWGTFLLAGLLRLVVSHHLTFFINSLAHIIGKRPYTNDNTARDNWIVALLTFGEGYHNFHHMFANDYRNGVRWWQFDPSKWSIRALAWVGLARDLKTVPWFRIQRSILEAQFERAERQLAEHSSRPQAERFKDQIAVEWAAFQAAVAAWTKLREEWVDAKRRSLAVSWEAALMRSRVAELENALHLQYRRLRVVRTQLSRFPGAATA